MEELEEKKTFQVDEKVPVVVVVVVELIRRAAPTM